MLFMGMAWDICNFLVFTESGSKGPAVNFLGGPHSVGVGPSKCDELFIVYFKVPLKGTPLLAKAFRLLDHFDLNLIDTISQAF